MIKKIISGGQTGVDKGALEAAKKMLINTGGFCPKDFLTENGSDYSLKNFNLVETDTNDYSYRTILNAENSDGTVIFCKKDKFGYPIGQGTVFTLETLKKINKPFLINPTQSKFIKWLETNNIEILNIAGNRESQYKGIKVKVEKFLIKSLKRIYESHFNSKITSFRTRLDIILKDNKSGSLDVLDNFISILKSLLDNNYDYNIPKIYKYLKVNIKFFRKNFKNFAVFIHFINYLEKSIIECNKKKPDKLLNYIIKYEEKWKNVDYRIAEKFVKQINLMNKTILLHSRSKTIVILLKILKDKNINLKIYQTESRPLNEGILQAEEISKIGYKVNLITDFAFTKFINEIDFVILGADFITNKFIVNKIGSFSIASVCKNFDIPVFIIADSRKFIKKKIIFNEIEKPQNEIHNTKNKNIIVVNYYFEKIPLNLINKIFYE